MRRVGILLAALLVALSPMALAPEQARAQAQSAESVQSELRDVAVWSLNATQVVQRAFSIIETMPPAPDDINNRGVRRAWIATSRTWSVGARETLRSARAAYAALPPPPVITFSESLSAALRQQYQRMPSVIDGLAAYIDRYDAMFTAFERNDPKAMTAFAANSIDAIILPIAHMRDINDLTAATVGAAHPQSHLLSSVARSYDGMIALTNLMKQGIEMDNPPLGFAVEELDAAVTAMRRHVASGRSATTTMRQAMAMARGQTPEEVALIAQARRLIETYPVSFDREEEMARTLDGISRHLAAPGRRFDADDPVVKALYDKVVDLDDARVADQSARQAAVASE